MHFAVTLNSQSFFMSLRNPFPEQWVTHSDIGTGDGTNFTRESRRNRSRRLLPNQIHFFRSPVCGGGPSRIKLREVKCTPATSSRAFIMSLMRSQALLNGPIGLFCLANSFCSCFTLFWYANISAIFWLGVSWTLPIICLDQIRQIEPIPRDWPYPHLAMQCNISIWLLWFWLWHAIAQSLRSLREKSDKYLSSM